MKENNNKKTWNERIAEYVMSGQGGPGIREQLVRVESDGAVYRGTISKEDVEAYMEATYNSRQEQIDENLMNLYKGELVKRKMIQEGTFEDFMNSFNKQNPEWNKQKDTTKESSDGA
jgi:hypothetical protein